MWFFSKLEEIATSASGLLAMTCVVRDFFDSLTGPQPDWLGACFAWGNCQMMPEMVRVAVPGVTLQVPSVVWEGVPAGTVMAPGVVEKRPVVWL